MQRTRRKRRAAERSDALNRPQTVSYPLTGENLAYTWDTGCADGVGRLCQVSDAGGSTSFAYDARGNLVGESRSENGVTLPTAQYTYDAADRLASEVTATSKVLTAAREANGQIQQVSTAVGSNPQVNLVANVKVDAAGNTTAQTFGNGFTQQRTFNTDGTPSVQTQAPGGGGGTGGDEGDVPTLPEWAAILLGSALLFLSVRPKGNRRFLGVLLMLALPFFVSPAFADEALTYDADGNVQTRTLSGGTTTFGYDDLDRLSSEAGPAKSQSFTYDANGNRKTDGAGTMTYSANTDRLVTISSVTVGLDPAGNITLLRGYNLTWNQAGQLKTVSLGTTLLATYTYDYKGRRSRKVTTSAAPQGAGTVIYAYDLYDRLSGEFDGAGHPLRTYVWRDDVPVAIILQGATESVLYLETDHLNTPIAARNQAGQVMWKWEPDAFGIAQPNQDPGNTGIFTTINLRFPGQYYDAESGFFYNWHRYFDSKLGRYLSPDPIGLAGGANLYSYVGGNPLLYTDPKGLLQQCKSGLERLGGYQVGPLHHEFSCWKGSDGKLICRGYGRDPNSSAIDAMINRVSGTVLKDTENFSRDTTCEPDDKNACMDKCAADFYAGLERDPPPYSWTRDSATQCQAVNRRIVDTCKQFCSKR